MNRLDQFLISRLDVYGQQVSRDIDLDAIIFRRIVDHFSSRNLITPEIAEQAQKAATVFDRTKVLIAIYQPLAESEIKTSLGKYMGKTRKVDVTKLKKAAAPKVEDQPTAVKTPAKGSTFYDYAKFTVLAVLALGGYGYLQPHMRALQERIVDQDNLYRGELIKSNNLGIEANLKAIQSRHVAPIQAVTLSQENDVEDAAKDRRFEELTAKFEAQQEAQKKSIERLATLFKNQVEIQNNHTKT